MLYCSSILKQYSHWHLPIKRRERRKKYYRNKLVIYSFKDKIKIIDKTLNLMIFLLLFCCLLFWHYNEYFGRETGHDLALFNQQLKENRRKSIPFTMDSAYCRCFLVPHWVWVKQTRFEVHLRQHFITQNRVIYVLIFIIVKCIEWRVCVWSTCITICDWIENIKNKNIFRI